MPLEVITPAKSKLLHTSGNPRFARAPLDEGAFEAVFILYDLELVCVAIVISNFKFEANPVINTPMTFR